MDAIESEHAIENKNHKRQHHHNRIEEQKRLTIAIALTAVIMIAEVIGGFLSNSLALISDAGHMLTDIATLFLSLLALRFAAARRNDKYTFGFKRLEILAALINALALLVICAYIGYEGVQRLLHPASVHVPTMLIVATIGLVTNLFCVTLLSHSHNLNVRSAFLHVVGDLLSSVGIVIGGGVMLIWNVQWIDPALSIVIAGVVLISGYRVIREATGVLMEAAPADVDVARVRVLLKELHSIVDVHDLHVWTITSGMLSLSCHIVVEQQSQIHSDGILQEINKTLKEKFGIAHTTIQIESSSFSQVEDPCATCE